MTAQAIMLDRSCKNGLRFEVLSGMDPRVKHAVAFFGDHLPSRIKMDEVAAAAGLSVSQFSRLFRRDTGSTPSSFVNRLRLERAAVLLERTSLSVSEVMAQVGVNDPSHFARDFRRMHGFSPRTFRQHLREAAGPPRWPATLATPPPSIDHQEDENIMMKLSSQPTDIVPWSRDVKPQREHPAHSVVAEADERRSGRQDRRRFTRTDRRRESG